MWGVISFIIMSIWPRLSLMYYKFLLICHISSSKAIIVDSQLVKWLTTNSHDNVTFHAKFCFLFFLISLWNMVENLTHGILKQLKDLKWYHFKLLCLMLMVSSWKMLLFCLECKVDFFFHVWDSSWNMFSHYWPNFPYCPWPITLNDLW